MRARHVLSLLGVASILVGCQEYVDRMWDDDDDVDIVAEIESTDPEDGEEGFYHRNLIRVRWDGAVTGASVVLEDGDGNEILGNIELGDDGDRLTFDPFGDDPDSHLEPTTAYIATISWKDHDPVEITLSTSDVGTTLPDPQAVVGRDYALDLASATFTDPPGAADLLVQNLAGWFLVLHIESIEGAEIQVYGTYAADQQGAWVQDLCHETWAFTSEDGEPGPGLFDNPYFSTGPHDLRIAIDGYVTTLEQLEIGGSFNPDGEGLAGATLDAFMDTRVVGDPHGYEGAQCELLESQGIECVECPDGSGPYCLFISGYDMAGERVDVTGENPETGEKYTTLTEVTEEMVDAWKAAGYCP